MHGSIFPRRYLVACLGMACAFGLSQAADAALVWTGAGDGISLYQEANWLDDNGLVPALDTINPNVAVTAATGGEIEITAGTGQPSNYGGAFQTGSGNDLTVTGKILQSSGSSGLRSGTDTNTLVGDESVLIGNGGLINVQFVLNYDVVTVTNGGTLTLRGAGNPVNNTLVTLELGGTVNFLNEDVAAFNAEHLSKFTPVGGTLQVVSDGASGSIVTVVPEPTSLALLGLGGLLIARRRRA
ncbi:MAG: PEP-CTERM sorting domain-containing protein [Phycisphaeraceae bacterium]|jgi:hypothetical protein